MSCLFDEASDTEKEVANILLELRSLFLINNAAAAVPAWGFKGRRAARRTIVPPRQRCPPNDHGVASRLETSSSCKGGGESESDNGKTVTDIEENPSEIKAEPSGLEPSSISKGKVKEIKFKPPGAKNSPQIGSGGDQSKQIIINDEPSSPKEDVCPAVVVMESKKKTSDKRFKAKEEFEGGIAELTVLPEGHLVGGSRKIKAEPTTVLEANPLIPHKKPAKRKSLQEMKDEVVFWEQNKSAFLESIQKVKDYLEKQKALNLQLKARKLQLSSIKAAKSDSG